MPKSFRDSLFIPDPPTVVRVRGEPIGITRAGIRREGEPGASRVVLMDDARPFAASPLRRSPQVVLGDSTLFPL